MAGRAIKRLVFVRHGRTAWNAIGRMQGQWNSDLDELGRTQAHGHGRLLQTLQVDALFASPLDRTRQTAEIIAGYIDLPIRYDDRIKEWDCGDWSGHLYTEVQAKWPAEWAAYAAAPFHYRGPNCETYPDMIARSTPFLDELRAHPAATIAIVSHGMIGRVMIATLLGLDEAETLSFHQPNDRVYCVDLAEVAAVSHFVGDHGPVPGLGEVAR